MNHAWNWSFSMGEDDQDKGLWALEPCDVFPVSSRESLLSSRRRKAMVVVANDLVQPLLLCQQFRTLKGHLDAIAQAFPPLAAHRGKLYQVLEQLKQQGLLIGVSSLLEGLRGECGADLPALEKVAILTCDRPHLLKRLLYSLMENEKRYGNRYSYLVFDDSKKEANQSQNRALVQSLQEEGHRILYEGVEEQQARIDALIDAFPEHRKTILWLLARDGEKEVTTGRVGNHMLLATAGERLLHLDDDMVCQPRKLVHLKEAVEISDRDKLPWFFPDPEAREKALLPLEKDPLQEHANLLGYPLAQACARLSASLSPQSFAYFKSLDIDRVARDTPVLLTSTGTLGDPGTSSNHWLYFVEDEAACRLFFDAETAYRRYRSRKDMWLSAPSYQFNTAPSVMTSALRGIDQRVLMPPFFPWGSNVDYFFGGLVRYLHPHALGFDFPWSLGHYPQPMRQWPEDALDRPRDLSLLGFLGDIALGLTSRSLSRHPERRLELLGETFLGLADAEEKTWKAMIKERRLVQWTHAVYVLDKQLARFPDAPSYWKEDVRRLRATYTKAIQGMEATLWQGLRETLEDLGQALKAWPTLWHCSVDVARKHHFVAATKFVGS